MNTNFGSIKELLYEYWEPMKNQIITQSPVEIRCVVAFHVRIKIMDYMQLVRRHIVEQLYDE